MHSLLNADKHSPASSARSTKRRVRGGCLCQWELKAPTDRSRSDCVHEQVAKRIANVRFTNSYRWQRKDDMNIQIFGTKKCNDTKKAERFFKERGIKYQFIDMKEKGMSKGEFNSVAQANGGLDNMVNWDGKDKDLLALIKYIADDDKLEKVLENPQVIKTPVVRNGKQSTLGYMPDIWKNWN